MREEAEAFDFDGALLASRVIYPEEHLTESALSDPSQETEAASDNMNTILTSVAVTPSRLTKAVTLGSGYTHLHAIIAHTPEKEGK